MKQIITNIREIRLNKGVTQEAVADALDVDPSVVSNIEKGKRELKVSELEKIALALGEDVVYLITYPHRFVNRDTITDRAESDEKISVTFEVPSSQRQSLIELLRMK